MKTSLGLFSALLLGAAHGFAPSSIKQQHVGVLNAATGLPPKGYSGVNTVDKRVRKVTQAERNKMPDVMIDPDYTLAIGTAALCPLIIAYHPSFYADGSLSLIGVSGGLFHLVFAALLWVQTRRVRLVFEKDGFEFYNIKGPGLDLDNGARLERKPENYVSGTVNRWKYDSITNYRYFPSLDFPFIVYFKETETPEWKWNRWFAAFDAYGKGQPHFFPGICNARQFKKEMEARGVYCKPIITMKQLKDE